jgi:D-sedoheptulose 7-phosphate isomerase
MDIVHELNSRIKEIRALYFDNSNLPENQLLALSSTLVETFRNGNKIAFVGNGGSAAEAMHLAAEFTGKCVVDHVPLAAICLNESQSALTAIGNDYGFDKIFSRQVEAHLREGDLLIALSTSGRSANILNALTAANTLKVRTYLWMGNFELDLPGVEIWRVNSKSTPRVQEVHLSWGHLLAELVEIHISKYS